MEPRLRCEEDGVLAAAEGVEVESDAGVAGSVCAGRTRGLGCARWSDDGFLLGEGVVSDLRRRWPGPGGVAGR